MNDFDATTALINGSDFIQAHGARNTQQQFVDGPARKKNCVFVQMKWCNRVCERAMLRVNVCVRRISQQ